LNINPEVCGWGCDDRVDVMVLDDLDDGDVVAAIPTGLSRLAVAASARGRGAAPDTLCQRTHGR